MTQVLVLPGYQNSGPQHWQSLWIKEHPGYRRVGQRDWDFPLADDWVRSLDQEIAKASDQVPAASGQVAAASGQVAAAPGQVALVGHSLGCIAVARWAAAHPDRARLRVKAALLVAPADVERLPDLPLGSFAPISRAPLPFRTTVVGSRDDPYMSYDRTEEFAASWGAELIDIGDRGHINADSGLGSWPEGHRILTALLTPGNSPAPGD